MAIYTYIRFAQAYGDGAYSSCTYNGVCTNQGTGTTDNGSLVNSGVAVAGIVTLACLIALVAVLVRLWRRPSKPVPQEETIIEDENNSNLPDGRR